MSTMTTDEVVARIAAITKTNEHGTFNPSNGVVNRAKRDVLMASMAEDGWLGAPLLVDGGNALTGSHRLDAQARLWNEHGIAVPIPYAEVSNLCEEFGLDWAAILEEHDEYEPDTRDYDVAASVIALAQRLPVAVLDYLGLDVR